MKDKIAMKMKELPKKYNHRESERRWQQEWEQSGVYHWDESQPRENTFVIDTPPPTVSGLLHMGHIYSYTQADYIARFQRMSGKTVFYPMGFDDNGLPTERLVEKAHKVRATDMSREEFIKLCESVSEEARADFRALFKTTALSVDWRQEYHTISAQSRKISQLSFLDLFHKGRAYRKLQPMLWDPVDQTAIAQAEVVDKEMESHFNEILFGVEGSEDTITIATTRPELIPACVAIFYHPDDERYRHLAGKYAITPLFGVRVPILADDTVEMDKGTGIMMCCTFGDEADIDKWRRHELPTRIIINKYGKMDFNAVDNSSGAGSAIEALSGLKVTKAREKILELLQQEEVLLKQEKITHAVKCAERSGAPLELLPTQQWFVKLLDQKPQLKEKAAQCEWYPPWMKTRMDQWIDGLNWDWCISRQRYFGVPFPVWYSKRAGEEGKILVAKPEQLPVNPLVDLPPGYTRDEVEADSDVMDTWATSSISPQLSSKGIAASPCPSRNDDNSYVLDPARHAKLFPADLRPQAHEIIRTWAFYTIVKAHLHENTIPWKKLMISGWCLAEDKTKMSKSKGNVVTPIELIEDYSADVVRYWSSTSKLGTDTAFSRDLLKIGKKLVTKLWNATKFAAIHLDKIPESPGTAAEDVAAGRITETLDLWILTRLRRAIDKATQEFEQLEYADARAAVEDFFWNDFCDNYLELVKKRVYGEGADNSPSVRHPVSREASAQDDDERRGEREGNAAQLSAAYTIHHCLDGILRLFAPIMPHITEELWSHIFADKFAAAGSIHARGNWPQARDYPLDEPAESHGIATLSLLEVIRKAKSEKGVSIKYPLQEVKITMLKDDASSLPLSAQYDLCGAGNIETLEWESGDDIPVPEDAMRSEDARFALTIGFAAENAA